MNVSLKNSGLSTRNLIGIALIGIVLAVLPFVIGMAGQSWVRILNFALLYVMLSLGLNIVVGFAGLLDLGYIAFYAVGAYTWALLASPHFGLHLPFWAILPIALAVACLFGVLLGAPTLKLRGDYLAIVTLGFGEIIRIFLNNLNAPINITNGPQGINRIDTFKVGEFSFGRTESLLGMRFTGPEKYYYLLLAITLIIIVVCVRLQNSRIGRAWEAIREDEIAAKAMGINTRNMKLLAFGMGATFGGVSGTMFAAFQGFVSPESFSLMESVMIVAMVVLGGIGHLPGVILGAVLLSALPEVLRWVSGVMDLQALTGGRLDASILRQLLIALAMIIIMLLRPRGLWPTREHGKALPATK